MRSKTILTVFILSVLLSVRAQSQEQKYQVACVAFYNVENLFDTINQPEVNDEEFTPEGSNRWNSVRYWEKMDHLSTVITQIGDEYVKGGPVLIGLSEIENRSVLEDLVKQPAMAASGYDIVHIDGPDRRGVDVALLYRKANFTVIASKSIRLTMPEDTAFITRDQLLVSGLLDGEEFFIIVNHWPSRRGGEKASAPKRNAAAALARHTVDSLQKINPAAKVIVMGDLNDDPINKSVAKVLQGMPTQEEARGGKLYNPMHKLFKTGVGSLAYKDSWNLFDQIIISEGLLGSDRSTYKYYQTHIFNKTFLTQKEGSFSGYPWRTYVGNNYQGGYSDHFPAYIFLAKIAQ